MIDFKTIFKKSHVRISIIYLIISVIWIFSSEQFLFSTFDDLGSIQHFQLLKGLLFVISSTLIIYLLIKKSYDKLNQRNQKLIESEEKNRLLFENMLNGFALHEIILDENGDPVDYRFLEINNAFENLTGLKREKTIGRLVTDILAGAKEDPANWIGTYGKVALGGMPIKFDQYSKDINKWFSINVFSPRRGLFATIFLDITERILAEEKLRESESFISSVLNNILFNIAIIDETGKIILVNDTWRKFAVENDLKDLSKGTEGSNYITVCEQVKGKEAEQAMEVAVSIRKILAGEIDSFSIVYPCHSQTEKRWFNCTIASLVRGNANFAIISHENITQRILDLQTISESEERFRTIITNNEGIFFMLDKDGTFTLSEGKGLAALGLSPGEVVGKSVYDVYKDFPKIINDINEALSGKTINNVINVGDVYFNIWYSPRYDHKNSIIGIMGMAVNITDRTIAEKNLRILEERYRSVIESATDAIISINQSGVIIGWNNAAEKNFGYTLNEAIGKNINILMPAKYSKDHAAEIRNAIQSNIFKNVNKGPIELSGIRKDGTEFPFEMSLSSWNIEETKYFTAFIRNVTQKKKDQLEIIRLSKAVTQSPISIIITDTNGNIEYVNPMFTKITGYTFEEVKNENPRILKSGKQSKEFYKKLWDTISSGEIWSGVLSNKKKNGELFWESAIISPIKDQSGSVSNYLAVKEDITEDIEKEKELKAYRENLEEMVSKRTEELNTANKELQLKLEREKKLEKQLEDALSNEKEINELKTRFIATVSHEFRTPLAALLSSAQIIERYSKKWSEEKIKQHYERIDITVKFLTQMLDDVLTISRSESEILQNNPEQVNAEEVLHSFADEIRSQMTEKHNLKLSLTAASHTINIDRSLLRHAVVNLLSNSVKYSPDGCEINFSASIENGKLILSVSDEGMGISEDEIKYIFDQFYRAKNTVGIHGTGLGLNIVKRSVDLMGGVIEVKSKINKGTTFTVTIPIETNE